MTLLLGWYLGISALAGVALLATESRLVRVRGILSLLKFGALCVLVGTVAMLSGWRTYTLYPLLAGLLLSFAPVLILSLMAHISLRGLEKPYSLTRRHSV